jgi:hypothetical protein
MVGEVLWSWRRRKLVVRQAKIDGLRQASGAGEARGERDFSCCCEPSKIDVTDY